MTQRAINLANAIAAELLGKTFGGVTLSGDSAPTRRNYVVRSIKETGAEARPLIVSVVPRGKDRTRAARSTFAEAITVAVVLQQKLDPAVAEQTQVDALAAIVEEIDDHLAEVAPTLADAAFDESTINPFWNVDDLLDRQQFTGLLEITYAADRDDD